MTPLRPTGYAGQTPALIADLGAAPCGSPDLDARVAIVRGWMHMEPWMLRDEYWVDPSGKEAPLPPWTTSTDVAMTLVPDDWSKWGMISWGELDGKSATFRRYDHTPGSADHTQITGDGATIPLAIVAAALKIGERE